MAVADQLAKAMNDGAQMYYRLVLVVGLGGKGKTRLLQETHKSTGAPLLNVNLELSRRMLDLTERQRVLQLPTLLAEVTDTPQNDVVLLDNTEILFDVTLKQDPLRLLQGISRNRTIVASWNGAIDGGYLTYGTPAHREYRRYAIRDFLVVNLNLALGT